MKNQKVQTQPPHKETAAYNITLFSSPDKHLLSSIFHIKAAFWNLNSSGYYLMIMLNIYEGSKL